MRLLNIKSLKFREFYEEDTPRYWILSHRWGEDEVSYKDFLKRTGEDGLPSHLEDEENIPDTGFLQRINAAGRGYRKILDFCQFARHHRAQFRIKERASSESRKSLTDSEPPSPSFWTHHWSFVEARAAAELHNFDLGDLIPPPPRSDVFEDDYIEAAPATTIADVLDPSHSEHPTTTSSLPPLDGSTIPRRTDVTEADYPRHGLSSASLHSLLDSRDGVYQRSRSSESENETFLVEWVWIDTCCIDKSSSSELSEAINSMYRWYANAEVCIVHLSDVESGKHLSGSGGISFRDSSWFRRGWTLQELLAPRLLIFCDASWRSFGHICQERPLSIYRGSCSHSDEYGAEVSKRVAKITRIPIEFLRATAEEADHRGSSLISIAQKMSWASRRRTSRVEDEAYCLLGIFGVNMPLIYGEGKAAFLRLQQEIIKGSADQSIFAWMSDDETGGNPLPASPKAKRIYLSPLFAPSPAAFVNCGAVTRRHGREDNVSVKSRPFTVTNLGLEMRVNIVPVPMRQCEKYETYFAYLNCSPQQYLRSSSRRIGESGFYRMALIKLDDHIAENRFGRLYMGMIETDDTSDDEMETDDAVDDHVKSDELIYIDNGRGAGQPELLEKARPEQEEERSRGKYRSRLFNENNLRRASVERERETVYGFRKQFPRSSEQRKSVWLPHSQNRAGFRDST